MSEQPQPPPQGPGGPGPGWPQSPPVGPGGWPGQPGPSGQVPPTAPEQPLHPALVAPPAMHRAHTSPHAASSGPQDGARGAMWFALVVLVVVAASLVGALVLSLGG